MTATAEALRPTTDDINAMLCTRNEELEAEKAALAEELLEAQGQRDAAIVRAQVAEDRAHALALWREEVQSHVERDCIGTDQWHDELVELVAESYSLAAALVRRDDEQFRQGFWWGFERARCHLDQISIRAEFEDVQELRRRQAPQADTAGEAS